MSEHIFCTRVPKSYYWMDVNLKKINPPYMNHMFFCSDKSYRFLRPKRRRDKTFTIDLKGKQMTSSIQTNEAYTFLDFTKDFQGLREKIDSLVTKIDQVKPNERIKFQDQLDSLNFEQMNLNGRVRKMGSKEVQYTTALMDSMTKTLEMMDKALYTPKISPTKEFVRMMNDSFCRGVISAAIGSVIGKLLAPTEPLTANTPIPKPMEAIRTVDEWKAYQENIMKSILCDNDSETPIADFFESFFNGEWGTCARDVIESDAAHDFLETVGNEILKD